VPPGRLDKVWGARRELADRVTSLTPIGNPAAAFEVARPCGYLTVLDPRILSLSRCPLTQVGLIFAFRWKRFMGSNCSCAAFDTAARNAPRESTVLSSVSS
jgi:hypothetical protein